MKNYPLGFSAVLILFMLLMMPIMAQEPTATPETPTNTVTPSATATSTATATVTLTSTATATNTATATPLPAYNDIDACWVRHVNGTAATEWEITNPNPVPIVENPNTKLIYDWWAYDSADAQGTVVNSVLAWDGNGPNPISTNYAQSLRVVWYMVTEGQPASGTLGELIINAGNTITQCPSAATPTATATAMSGSGDLRIQLRENGADNNQQTSFVYLLINEGSTAPSNITVRMYFTLDSNFSASDYVLDQSYDSSNGMTITGPFLHDNDTYYFEMDYGSLALNPSSNWEWSGFMHHQNWLTGLSSANDWWITGGLQQAFTDTDYMPVYINGVLVLGQEPPLNATPTPSLTPTTTLTPSETPDVTNTPTATPDPASGDVIVELKANGADNVQQAGFAYRISNTGTTDYDLITVRIYMQIDNQQAYSSYVAEGYYDSTNNVTISGPHAVDSDVFYFELDYASLIFGNGSVWEWNGITRLTDWSANFDSNNDWWKTGGLPADYEQTVYIPVYSNGVLIAGSEPNTGAPTETPTATATSTETLTPTATVTETETPTATATSNAIPTVTLTSANANYIEGSAPIAVVSAVDIQDDGLELCSATVQILNAVDADEVLAVNNTNPAMTVSYDLPTHTLTLSGLAPITDYVTVLESLTYENTASTPNTDSRDLSITVNDCTSTSPAQLVRVDVSATNDAPVINLDLSGVDEPNYVTTYTEGMPQLIVGAVTVTDTDSTHLSALIAEISNPLGEDVLSVDPGTSTLVASYNAGILTITGYAPVADYEVVLASLTYDNLSDAPDTTDRIVTIVANDGENSSVAVTSTVSIVAVNTAPDLNLDSLNSSGLAPNVAVSYITDAPVIPITHDVSITDPEETVLASALITLTGIVDGTDEVLSVDTSGTAITASSYTVDSGTGTLTLSGNDSLDNYALVLESLRYINTAVTPTLAGDRIATISVNDGTSDSAVVTSTISLVEPDPLPDGVQCYSWQAGIAQGWIDVSANPLIVWDVNGMYSQSPTSTETMQAQFNLPTNEPYSLVFSSNDALPYSLYNGETTGDVTTLISAQAGENYIVPGGVVELQWDVVSYTNLSETLVFEDFCFAPVANVAPIVDAGDDQTIYLPTNSAQLEAIVTDNTSFASALSYSWAILSDPTGVSLSDNTIVNPILSVTNAGVVTLELTVSDGEFSVTDTVEINVLSELDLTVSGVDNTMVNIDPNTLTISGTLSAQFETTLQVDNSFIVTVFEDLDGDYLYTQGIDNTLATQEQAGLTSGAPVAVNLSVNGTLDFSNSPLYVFVDSTNVITEIDETNNIASSIGECTFGAPLPPQNFQPTLERSWNLSGSSSSAQVMMTPLVIDINQDTVPDIIFTTFANGSYTGAGIVRAISGDDMSPIWSNSAQGIHAGSHLATGDIDNDGNIEVIGISNSGYIVALNSDGTLFWQSTISVAKYIEPTLADLDQDGTVEVIVGANVVSGVDGTTIWSQNISGRAVVADIDLDGSPDVIVNNRAYEADGTIKWTSGVSGFPAIANFDSDDQAEIIIVGGSYISRLEHDGTLTWSVQLQGGSTRNHGGAPTIADMDGDGMPEIGVAGGYYYSVYEADGTLKWSQSIRDYSSNVTASSVFDFDGDGRVEVVYSDELTLWVFDGTTGSVIWSTPSSSGTLGELPVIADVDADGQAEIIVASNNYSIGTQRGIQVYGDSSGEWVSTRQIWNQQSYHITNINDDGTIPQYETNNWQLYNNYRQNLLPNGCATGQADVAPSKLIRNYDGTDYTLSVRIGNGGNRLVAQGIMVAFYDGDPAINPTPIATGTTNESLGQGEFTTVTVTVIPDGTSGWQKGPIWVVADSDDSLDEINELNNTYSSNVYLMIPPNEAPVVTATADELAIDLAVDDTIALSGTITDTTLPIGQVEANWVVVSSPDAVTFSQQDTIFTTSGTNNVASDVTFTAGGEYVFALRGLDGEFTSTSDTLTITVTTPPEPPAPPQPNQTLDINGCIALPSHADSVRGLVDIVVDGNTSLTNTSVFYWSSNDPQAYVALAEGLEVTANATVAVFDTTVLTNDTYGVQLVGYDSTTLEEVVCGVGLYVTGEYKPGRVVLSTTDFTIPLAGLPITVGRTYDSLERNIQSDFGYGWSLALGDPRLEIDDSNNITLTLPNGQRKTFYWAPNPYPIGGFVAPNYQSEIGEYGSVSTNGCPLITGNICFPGSLYSQSVTQVTYEDPYGRAFTYGTDGRLDSIQDLNGNLVSFELDGIYSNADPNNPQLVTFTRDAEGRITQITDNANQVYDYSYDANGDLVAVILPDTASTVDPTIGYSYYTEAEGLAHFFKSGTDPRGNPVIATTYDADGRLASVTDGVNNQTSYSYDVPGRTTTVTNPDSSTMVMGYDEWGNLTGETDELGRTTSYAYDPNNYNLLSVTNNDNETTSYDYDAQGNRTSVTNGLGIEVISASYNAYGAPQTLRDANGVTRNIGYDASTGMPLSASDPLGTIGSYTWNAQGSPTAVTDASGATTIYDYDDYGNVISQTAPATSDGSNVMLYGYDSMGRRISSKNFEGTFTETIYDALGNVVSVTTYTDEQKTEILSVITYEYDANGNRTAVIDAANKRTEYLYDNNNRVVRVTAPNLTYSTTKYDWRGNVIEQASYSEGDMLQNSTCYGYDAAGQLTDVTQNCQIAGAPAGFVPVTTHYVYDNAGRRIETYEAWTGNPASSVLSSQVVYDDAGRVTSTTDAAGISTSYGYDPAGQLLTVTDALNRVTRYEYDVRGRRTRTIYPDGTFSVTQYDAVGRVTRQTDALGYQMSYSYDAVGNLLNQTRASNTGIAQTTQYDYDVLGRRISMTDARGGVSQYVYDNLGRMSAMCDASVSTCTTGNYTATYSYNLLGQQTSVTDANGNMTSYSYDNMNRPEMIVYASGASIATTETIAYNARGQRISTTYAGYETAYSYDDMGRLSSTCQIVSGMCQQTTSYSYDLRGRQIATTNANGVTSRMVYDDASRLTMNIANFMPGSAQDPGTWSFNGTNWTDGSTTISHGVNADTNIISQYSYDALGRRASVRDVNGNVTSYTYESLTNRLAVMTHPDNTSVSYNYDALGRRTRMTDENGNATNYSYDPLGRLTAVQNPEGETVSYGYDANSNVTRITNGRNNSIRFVYDELNRLLGKCDAEGAYNCTDANPANHSYTTEYMYDANGNLVQEVLADNTLNLFEYDALNRLSYEVYGSGTAEAESFGYSYDARGLLETVYVVRPSVATANDVLSSYSYDALARPTAVTHEDGQSVHYGYDDVGNRIGMRTEIDGTLQTYVTYDHDALNRVTEVNDHEVAQVTFDPNTWLTNTGATTTVFAYSSIGQMTTIARPNGVTTHYSYDPQRYFVDEIEHLNSTSTLGRYQYDYDAVGNRTGMDITAQDGSVTQIDYAYDDAYRLTSESYLLAGGATSTTSYQYDRAGNRTQMSNSSGTTTYSYNKDDELVRVDLPDFYFEDYVYDERGNLVETSYWREGVVPVQQGSPTLFEYSPRNLLTRVELPSTQRIDYSYDHLGNRVEQSVVGAQNPTHYLWDEFSRYGDVVLETGVNFTTSDFYHKMDYVLASGMLVSQTNFSGNVQYFLSDAQGTTRSITDDMGVVTSEYQYDAFGNLDENIDPISIESTYLYTGQQFDPYTELYNLRARTYNPSNARFLSRDTWAYNYQNPVELNRYGYSQNNPATYSDPSGNTSLITYAQRVTSSTVISAGLRGVVGGLANVLMEYLFAWIFQTEAQPLIAFGEGFVGGAAGYYAGNYAKAGKILSKFLELFVEFGVGVGFDVGARGENLGTSVLFNLGAGAVGLGFEQLGRKAAPYIVDAFPWLGRYFGIDPNSPNIPTGPTTPDSPIGSGLSDSPNNTPDVGDTGGNGVNGDGHNGTTDGGNGSRNGDGGSANICGALNSFSADTTVETPDGDVPISEIKIGDIVIAYDENTGVVGEYTVTDTISHEDDQIAYVTINGEEIETTPWHLFYTSDGWVEAGELEVGDRVVSLSGVDGSVDRVIVVDATQTMYDLTVEEVHTFAVGNGDWVVHNQNPCNSSEMLVNYNQNPNNRFRARGQSWNVTLERMRHILQGHHPNINDVVEGVEASARPVDQLFHEDWSVDEILTHIETLIQTGDSIPLGSSVEYRGQIDGRDYAVRTQNTFIMTFFPIRPGRIAPEG